MKNWVKYKLNEVCKIGDGNHSSNYPKSNEMVSEGIPFIRANNMLNSEVVWNDMKFITPQKHQILKKGHLKAGDILFTNRGEIGKIAIVGSDFENANLNSQIAWFRCLEKINNRFLFYFLASPSMKRYYSVEKNGAALQQFTIRQINEIEIPLPPLPEQQRIVSILEEAFSAIAKAKANAEKNLKNAKELFESYLQGVFEKKGDGWEERKLGESDLVEIIDGDRGKNYPTQKDFLEDGFCLFMNTKNVRPDGFEFETTMFINEAKDKAMGKGKLKRNDVVMTTRGTIGNLGVYDDSVEFENIRINSGMLIFRPNTKVITPNYLFETFRSGIFKAQIKKYTTGAAQPQLPIKTLVNFTIPVPKSIEAQQTIVRQLDALRAETQKLEAVYQKKIDDLEELKKSILQKAFAGELTESKIKEPCV